jgi:hypothetical protein
MKKPTKKSPVLKKVLRHRNKLVKINIEKKDKSIDFAIKIIDMLIDGEITTKNLKP